MSDDLKSRCAIGLVTRDGERDIVGCVQSIVSQTEPPAEIIWIDNASSDETLELVRRRFPDFAQPEIMAENTGFCAAHNRAFERSHAPYYLALNQDAFLAPGYIERICDWMDENPSLGAVSGLILDTAVADVDADANVYSAGMAVSRGRVPYEIHMGRPPNIWDRDRRLVPAVTGAAIIVRRDAVRQVRGNIEPLFPEEFFAYFEEVDLALALARGGFRCGVEGAALAWHAARGQGGRYDHELRYHYFKNHWLLSLRHDSWLDWLREAPQLLRGEWSFYKDQYRAQPKAFVRATAFALNRLFSRPARVAVGNDPTESAKGRAAFFDLSRKLLRQTR